MNPSHRLTWTLPLVLALALMGLISSVAVAITPATEELSLPCEAAESIEEGAIDTDNDGLTDQEETDGKLSQGQEDATTWDPTEPDNPDTDSDGICDGDEVKGFGMTLDPDDKKILLVQIKTDPTKPDTDGDKCSDGEERDSGTHPLKSDDRPENCAPLPPDDSTNTPSTPTGDPTPSPIPPTTPVSTQTPEPTIESPTLTPIPTPTPEPTPTSETILTPTPTPSPTPEPTPTQTPAPTPAADSAPTFNVQTIPDYTVDTALTALTLPVATGGNGTLAYNVSGLPPGLTFDPDTRTISGAPTEVDSFPIVYTVTDSDIANPGSDRLNFNIMIPDTDGDGLTDADEKAGWDIKVTFTGGDEVTMKVTSDPAKADTDDDGKDDKAEKQAQTDPGRADTDGDGIPDSEELSPFQFDNRTLNTDVTKADTDSDGLPDRLEKHSLKTDPTHKDSDRDGLTDMEEVAGWEIQIEVNGERNGVKVYSNPMTKDSDGDGIEDKVEKDGWQIQVDGSEVTVFSNPLSKDSDGDGIEDKVEKEGWQIEVNESGNWVEVSSNPSSSDTDGDGLNDGEEHQGFTVAITGKPLLVRTNPSSKDTDGDGKDDNLEIAGWSISVQSDDNGFKTDPSRSDSDGDGLPDFIVSGGTGQDPNPMEPGRGLPGTILGVLGTVLVSGQTPYSLLAVLVAAVGGVGWMWLRATRAVTGDAALQELRDQGHELDQLRREYGNLEDRTKREISRLQENVSSKDREVHQLQADLATYQASARRREEDLNSAAQDLVRAADELGERQWSDIIGVLTGVGGQDTARGDGNRVTASVSRHVNGLKRQVSEQKGRAQELVSNLRTQGLDISGIQGAVDRAPATALPSLIDSLEAVVQQHTIESQGKERLLLDIERAEAHCSRDITDSVGRRVPLQFLARAREMLEQATTQVELNAAVTIGDRIVDDIYRLYLPRATR